MPVSPADGERLVQALAETLQASEAALVDVIARRLARGITQAGWADAKLFEIQLLRRELERLLADIQVAVTRAADGTISTAQNRGAAAALAEARQLLGSERFPGGEAVARLLGEAIGQVVPADLWTQVLRSTLDVYRSVIAHAAPAVLTGAQTRLQAAQAAFDRLNNGGITSFVDAAGRRWGMAAYVEMATRTASGRAAVDGYLGGLNGTGLDLVYVSDSPRECPMCRPWEGKVLSVSGGTISGIAPNVTGGPPVRVRVDGTVAQARRNGLMHPNCRHRLTAYLPGATKVNEQAQPDPAGYEAQQRQRAIERSIREWKLRQVGALSPEADAAAGRKVRDWQKALREHLAENPALKRQSTRERIGTAR